MGSIALRNMKRNRERKYRCLGTLKLALLLTREETIPFGLTTGVDRGDTQGDAVMELRGAILWVAVLRIHELILRIHELVV